MPVITLTTDFGSTDSYVAQMKGVILGISPQVNFVDVTHAIPPQNVARGAAVLEELAHVFPAGTIHVAVIDPGVGSNRALLAVEAAGQRFVAPDNGLLCPMLRSYPPERIHRIEVDRFWRNPVSATFHGRDILGPVAAHWSRGIDIAEFGSPFDVITLVKLRANEPRRVGQALIGQIASVDAFGNLITNIRESDLPSGDRRALSIAVGQVRFTGISRSYSDQPVGSLLALVGSSGRFEIAVNQGNASAILAVSPGTEVRVE